MRTIVTVLAALLLSACVQTTKGPAPVIQFQKPRMVGDALPTSTVPLRSIKGIIGPVPLADQETIDLFVESFEVHVFRHEYSGGWPWVTKWNSFVRIHVEGNPRVEDAAKPVAQTLQQITGIPVSFGTNDTFGNVSIAVDTPENKAFDDDFYCFAMMYNRHDGSMDRGGVFIGEKIKGPALSMCLTEELSQIFGPGNDTDIVKESLWRPKQKSDFVSLPEYASLTWHDAIILRVLYNENIKPGMHRDDAMPIVRELIEKELKALNAA